MIITSTAACGAWSQVDPLPLLIGHSQDEAVVVGQLCGQRPPGPDCLFDLFAGDVRMVLEWIARGRRRPSGAAVADLSREQLFQQRVGRVQWTNQLYNSK